MCQVCFNGLVDLNIHKEISVNIEEVINIQGHLEGQSRDWSN